LNDVVGSPPPTQLSIPGIETAPIGPEVTVDLTTELRWFLVGRPPDDVVSWFTLGGTTGLAETRRDAYRLDGQVDIGVKRRYGTVLEMKLRHGPPEPFLHRELDGWLESWQRWSPADRLISLSPNTTWVDVDKTVIKRRFDCSGRELPLTEETRAMTGRGCDVEIATVSVDGHRAWTFAFAAFGPAEIHRTSIAVAWDALVGECSRPWPLRLRWAVSCGYPQWMADVCSDVFDVPAV